MIIPRSNREIIAGYFYADSHVFSWQADGTVTFRENHSAQNSVSPDYTAFDLMPFEIINSLVDKRKNAIHAFAVNIIRYFNSRYSVSVSMPEKDENFPICRLPHYQDYTNLMLHSLLTG